MTTNSVDGSLRPSATPVRGRTPLNRQQIIGFWAAWFGWMLDGMDSVIYALVLGPALTELLQTDVRLEMPPLPIWFTGRDAVTRFLARRAFAGPGDMVLVPTAANGQPAVAEYRRAADGVLRAHSIHVLDTGRSGVAALTVFLDPGLFSAFGLPPSR